MENKHFDIQRRTQEIAVQASPPYPPISVSGKNLAYAHILSADLAAAKSEMTAVNQYIYQSWAISSSRPAMAETIMRISRVEMRHMDILGQLILRLGGNPKLHHIQNRRAFAWNSGSVSYTQNITELLKINIADEQHAADTYMRQAKMIQDGDVSEMLARLSLDEALHKSIFEGFLAEIRAEENKKNLIKTQCMFCGIHCVFLFVLF